MEETSNNILTKKNLLFFLGLIIIILLTWFVWQNYKIEKNPGVVIKTSTDENGKTIDDLLAEEEVSVFESKDSPPPMFPAGFPAETKPVEIEKSFATKSLKTADKDLVFVYYSYFSILPKDKIFDFFQKFFVDNKYTLEKTVESSYSNLYATKGEYEVYSVTIAETDKGLSYVTISLTTK